MSKPVVVLDTNIYISATFWSGKPYFAIQKALNQEIMVFLSEDIVKEIRKVLKRDFFLKTSEIEEIVGSFLYFTHLIKPNKSVSLVKEDPDDNRILECALACKANYIVTQDKHLLRLTKFKGIRIRKPEDFLKELENFS